MTGPTRYVAEAMHGERVNEIAVIIGIKGAGKSTQARRLLEGRERVIIIDPMWEHTQGVLVTSYRDLVDYIRPRRFMRYRVVLRTQSAEDRDAAIALATMGTPDDPPLPGCTIFIDEIDKLCSPSSLPAHLQRLVNYGRHYRVSLIAAARRPKRIHHDVTANADRILVGKVQEPADLDYLADYIGETLAARARALQKPQFVEWPKDAPASAGRDRAPGAARRRGSDQPAT